MEGNDFMFCSLIFPYPQDEIKFQALSDELRDEWVRQITAQISALPTYGHDDFMF